MADLTEFEAKRASQNGEDGVIAELVRRIGAPGRWFVEFGIESGVEGNCVTLADEEGWSGLFIEGDDGHFGRLSDKYAHAPQVRTLHAYVLPDNLEPLLQEGGVPPEPDIFSIDIDSNDYYVWDALKTYRPRILIIEYNACIPLDRKLTIPYDPEAGWDGSDFFGASLGALERLGEEKGYRLVHTDTCGVNAFFVREDLADVAAPGVEPPRRKANFFNTGKGHPRDPQDRPWVDLDAGGALVRLSESRGWWRRLRR